MKKTILFLVFVCLGDFTKAQSMYVGGSYKGDIKTNGDVYILEEVTKVS